MICDRVAIIVNGEIVNAGRLSDLISEKVFFTEVIVSGIDAEKLENLGDSMDSQGEKIFLKVYDDAKLESILQLVESHKGRIHSLIPRTETLEDIFVGVVKRQ